MLSSSEACVTCGSGVKDVREEESGWREVERWEEERIFYESRCHGEPSQLFSSFLTISLPTVTKVLA